MISGKATSEDTLHYFQQYELIPFNGLGGTQLYASQVGFGTYRISLLEDIHQEALEYALLHGINLIDTSANFSEGDSEILIGSTLKKLIQAKQLKREEVILITKGGILQGEDLTYVNSFPQEQKNALTIVQPDQFYAYSIAPELLQYQITQSMNRLDLETLDIYLITNPEILLKSDLLAHLSPKERQEKFYQILRKAFEYLEFQVQKGKLQFYGISSNSWILSPPDDEILSLQNILELAESLSKNHHFKVIELPLNLIESSHITHTVYPKNQSIVKFAAQNGIAVITQRPLNALHQNVLFRLATPPVTMDASINEIQRSIQLLAKTETIWLNFLKSSIPDEDYQSKLDEVWAYSKILEQTWQSFKHFSHWQEMLESLLVPKIEASTTLMFDMNFLDSYADNNEFHEYLKILNHTLLLITQYYKKEAKKLLLKFQPFIELADPEWSQATSLSHMAIRACRSTMGISSVLVGMRRLDYVEDVLDELVQPVQISDRTASWEKLSIQIQNTGLMNELCH